MANPPRRDDKAQRYAEYLRGKRVIIVGPADYLTGQGKGAWIDSHDVIVRLNWGAPVPAGLKADLGTRTDVLYKRLLKLGHLDHIDVADYQSEGMQWIVAVDRGGQTQNMINFQRMVGDAIPWVLERDTRAQLQVKMRNSPLVGMVAAIHLLKFAIASLTITGCDFYDTGYQPGYGGRQYREANDRKEGVPSPMHDTHVQLRYLSALRATEPRLQFDEHLAELADAAEMKQTVRDVLVIIPARFESSRFPGKPLALIHGKPMIVHVCERVARACKSLVVATDDERIAAVVREHGFEAVMTGEAATGTDRVAQVAKKRRAQIYVNVQGDEPLIEPRDILAVIAAKRASPKFVVNGMCRLEGDAEDRTAVKAAVSVKGKLLYASRAPIPATKDGHAATWKQLGLYAFNREELDLFSSSKRGVVEAAEDVEILRFLELSRPVRMVEVHQSQAVDLPEHIAIVEDLMREAVPA